MENQIFDRIRGTSPDTLKKIKFLKGDLTLPGLGLSENDRQMIYDEINIVFHSAATIRFNEPLENALNMNTLGTKKIMELCMQMKNLSVSVD